MTQVTNYETQIHATDISMSGLRTAIVAMMLASVSLNRGAAAPSNPFVGMPWLDSSADPVETLKIYTSYGWITIFSLNTTTGVLTTIGTGSVTAADLNQLAGVVAVLTTTNQSIGGTKNFTGTLQIGGTAHGTHTGDVTGGAALSIASGVVAQAHLKTSNGTVSTTVIGGENLTLPGGQYGFYPRVYGNNAGTVIDGRIINGSTGSGSATANIYLAPTGGGTAYANQRYITSSGEVFWYFILRDKATGKELCRYAAPDHPCFGNGGDPALVPHPFPGFDHGQHEIIVINPNAQELTQALGRRGGRDLLRVLEEDYAIDDTNANWPEVAVTVGLPDAVDFYGSISGEKQKITPIKLRIPKAEYLLCKRLRQRR